MVVFSSVAMSEQGINQEVSVPVPWGILALKTCGVVSNDPVLCLHGWMDNCDSFAALLPLLPKDKFYVMMDFPGHGKSSSLPPGIDYTQKIYIGAIERVAQYYDWSHLSILGHSMGGNMGSLYSSIFPEKVDKLILLDVPGFYVIFERPITDIMRESVIGTLNYEKAKKTFVGHTYEEAKRRLMKATKVTNKAADLLLRRGTTRLENGMYRFSSDPRLKSTPFLILAKDAMCHFLPKVNAECFHILARYGQGSENHKFKDDIKRVVSSFTSCQHHEVITVEGGHFVHLCEPELVAVHAKRFLLRPKRPNMKSLSRL